MSGLGILIPEPAGSLVTPNRAVEVAFDADESVALAPAFSLKRYGGQIIPDPEAFSGDNQVELLKSGYWILRPLQGRLDKIHETTEMGSATMLLSEFNAAPYVKQEPLWRVPIEIPGVDTGASPTLATSANDLFFQIRRPAGVTWNAPLSPTSGTQPTLDSADIVMDRVMEATTLHVPDQGYLLRWHLPATSLHAPDTVLTFYFGGPLQETGFGEYCVSFHGDGHCTLWELAAANWQRRRDWRYALPHQVMDTAHTMRILPHMRRHLEFKSEINDLATVVEFWEFGGTKPYQAPKSDPSAELYTVNPSITGQGELDPNYVTGFGYVKVDVRRDLRPAWQVSRLQFPNLGELFDYPFTVPCFVDDNALLRVRVDGRKEKTFFPVATVTEVTTTVIDSSTGLPLAAVGDGWSLPAQPIRVAVRFDLLSFDVLKTPFVRGFSAEVIGTVAVKSIGETAGGALVDCQITGGDFDPTHETASLTIHDTLDDLGTVRARAGQNCRVQTAYDPAHPDRKSILIHGRVSRVSARRLGWDEGQEYPSPAWRELSVTLVGEWQRLHEQIMFGQFNFGQDWDAPLSEWTDNQTRPPPWTVDHVVKELIGNCGYPDNQIDVSEIAQYGTRLPLDQGEQIHYPSPFTTIGDYCQRLLREFLGAYLLWCANSINGGLRGMWRVKLGPTIPTGSSPLWSFTNEEPLGIGGVTLLGREEAYPAETTFIRRGSFISYTIPPEGNALLVTATGHLTLDRAQMNLTQCLVNYNSYDPPGGPGLADPAHPDYLGRFVPLVVTDILAAVGDTPAKKQASLDLFARRLYNIACRAAKRFEFEAPLVLVEDVTDTLLPVKRPLRFGDFIRVDGADCIVRACNPSFQKDHVMMAHMEAELYRPLD